MTTPRQPPPDPAEPTGSAPPPRADTPPPRRRRIRGAVRHRTTQLVAVVVLGLAIGAGTTALAAHEEGHDEGGHSVRHDGDHEEHQGER
ncbi:hypothetical protein [Umezawaea tangerina]|uniref:hypothetical protein n=1 Tax=Umezawaea tangerina TaxID=84725 RepID=UPI000D074E69|nr:hypothetical protein [Umezawaea tangerina]